MKSLQANLRLPLSILHQGSNPSAAPHASLLLEPRGFVFRHVMCLAMSNQYIFACVNHSSVFNPHVCLVGGFNPL